MKSVLISIQPKWCELISSGKKTVEVRKTRPKLDTPFKCYIYETKSPKLKYVWTKKDYEGYSWFKGMDENEKIFGKIPQGKGKVIAEFICDRIQEYECEFVDDDCYESIASIAYDEDGDVTGFIEWSNDSDAPYISTDFFQKCCVKYEELKKYIGLGFNKFYGWHISDLVIYDKPKELREFWSADKCPYASKDGCTYQYHCFRAGQTKRCGNTLSRPPQSWCYVEGVEGGMKERDRYMLCCDCGYAVKQKNYVYKRI